MSSPMMHFPLSDHRASHVPSLDRTDTVSEFTTMESFNAQHHAQAQIMQSLVDGLLIEGMLDDLGAVWQDASEVDDRVARLPVFQAHGGQPSRWFWSWPQDRHQRVVMLLQPGIAQAWEKVPRTPVIVVDDESGEWASLDPVASCVVSSVPWRKATIRPWGRGSKCFSRRLPIASGRRNVRWSTGWRHGTCCAAIRPSISRSWSSGVVARPTLPSHGEGQAGLSEDEYRATWQSSMRPSRCAGSRWPATG